MQTHQISITFSGKGVRNDMFTLLPFFINMKLFCLQISFDYRTKSICLTIVKGDIEAFTISYDSQQQLDSSEGITTYQEYVQYCTAAGITPIGDTRIKLLTELGCSLMDIIKTINRQIPQYYFMELENPTHAIISEEEIAEAQRVYQ